MVKIEAMERLNQRKKIKQLRHLILMDIALAFRKGNPIVRPCPIRSKTPFQFQLLHNVPYLIMATIPILHKTKPRSGESSSQLAWNEIQKRTWQEIRLSCCDARNRRICRDRKQPFVAMLMDLLRELARVQLKTGMEMFPN